jgi:hypothetical protein
VFNHLLVFLRLLGCDDVTAIGLGSRDCLTRRSAFSHPEISDRASTSLLFTFSSARSGSSSLLTILSVGPTNAELCSAAHFIMEQHSSRKPGVLKSDHEHIFTTLIQQFHSVIGGVTGVPITVAKDSNQSATLLLPQDVLDDLIASEKEALSKVVEK